MTLLARPAMAIVVTTTLQGSKKSSSSTTLNGIFFSVPTTGNGAAGPTIPNSRSTPKFWNFRATWSRSGSVGDDNEEFREPLPCEEREHGFGLARPGGHCNRGGLSRRRPVHDCCIESTDLGRTQPVNDLVPDNPLFNVEELSPAGFPVGRGERRPKARRVSPPGE